MELIGKLKSKVDNAASKEEKRSIIEEAGMALTDDELDMVAGGKYIRSGRSRCTCDSPDFDEKGICRICHHPRNPEENNGRRHI